MKLQDIIQSVNIAADLDKEELKKIGTQVIEGYEMDLGSREPWEKDLEKWTELALQITKTKTYPWPNASNVKYPLLSTASMQFAARAYPSLVPSDGNVVKCQTIGADPDGQKAARALRISKHMSYQLMNEMDSWEEDMDRLLIGLPISGTMFKKTYWDSGTKKNCSRLVYPRDVVVNYWAKSLEEAERVSERIELSPRNIKERQLQGIYLDVDLGKATSNAIEHNPIKANEQLESGDDDTTPYLVIEQHCFLDLDRDGYTEPYVVICDYASRKVLRIVARFDEEGVIVNEKGKVTSIEPINYYTKFSFVPNPDGGFYDIGFGRLLGTINASVDTIINQLIDAGSLSNLQAGFIGKGLRIKMGEARFSPGEWKAVNATGDDLKKQILPLPASPPNPVLLQLMQYLVQSGRELASVAEIMVGKMPGQNTPATTTMATIEQGMKVFTAVYKRVFRALASEFRKLYKLNAKYLNPETEVSVLDEPLQQSDYFGDPNDLIPGADPAAVSQQEKQAKAQMLMQLMGLGTLDPIAVTKYVLEAHEIPQPDQFFQQQPQQQPPDPKMEMMKVKAQIDQQKGQAAIQNNAAKLQQELSAQADKQAMERAAKEQDLKMKMIAGALKVQEAQAMTHQSIQQKADQHKLDMVTQAQKHQQAMRMQHSKSSKGAKE